LCATLRKKLVEVNKKLGEKFEISDSELLSTVDACKALMEEGQDIDTGAASTQVNEWWHCHVSAASALATDGVSGMAQRPYFWG
jgi:hypothetical protein